MSSSNLIWLSDWYNNNCNGNWEHMYGVRIETLDNPGWELTIDLSDIIYHGNKDINLPWRFIEKNENDWYGYKIEDEKFNAAGDPLKLDFLIGLFRDVIENCSSV